MADCVVGWPAEADSGQHGPKRAVGEAAECLLAADSGQREPIPQQGGEPYPGEQLRGTDVGETPRQRRHVGQRFVDIEHDHTWTRLHSGTASASPGMIFAGVRVSLPA